MESVIELNSIQFRFNSVETREENDESEKGNGDFGVEPVID